MLVRVCQPVRGLTVGWDVEEEPWGQLSCGANGAVKQGMQEPPRGRKSKLTTVLPLGWP